MSKIKCLLIDDEPPAIELLEKYVGMVEQLEVVGKSLSAVKAFDMLNNQTVDLMFLDIQMPVINGLDFIKSLKNPPAIILTTAYRKYALDGYDLDIIDYLLKPIAFDRFLKAVDRYRNRTDISNLEFKPEDQTIKHIFFNINRTHHKVLLKDILYVESLKDYVRVHTTLGALIVKGNIGSMMKRLPANLFIRIHRSFAVALQHVKSFNQSEVNIGEISLPIGGSYKEEISARMK